MELEYLLKRYGEVPPPWIFRENSHPLSIEWRMGTGESFIDIFNNWWDTSKMSEIEAFEYFKKYNPPPRWLWWVCCIIWDIEVEVAINYECEKYFAKLARYGFERVDEFDKDFDDPKWLET